jgi:hypothetical protein
MPIENRLDMELTGIKTPVGIKIQGPSLDGIEALGARRSAGSPRPRSSPAGVHHPDP